MRLLPLLLLILFSGCADSGPAMAPVTGTVTLDGKPLANGAITFEAKGHRPANGKIKDGEIVEVYTRNPGDGAPVAFHKVAIFALKPEGDTTTSNPGESTNTGENYMGTGSLIPARYNNPETSKFTADVKDDRENSFTFELKSE